MRTRDCFLVTAIAPFYPSFFNIAGAGDFNGDGTSDILSHASSNGSTAIASLQNNQQVQWTEMGTVPTFLSPI
jgi:hypothetical protein